MSALVNLINRQVSVQSAIIIRVPTFFWYYATLLSLYYLFTAFVDGVLREIVPVLNNECFLGVFL